MHKNVLWNRHKGIALHTSHCDLLVCHLKFKSSTNLLSFPFLYIIENTLSLRTKNRYVSRYYFARANLWGEYRSRWDWKSHRSFGKLRIRLLLKLCFTAVSSLNSLRSMLQRMFGDLLWVGWCGLCFLAADNWASRSKKQIMV